MCPMVQAGKSRDYKWAAREDARPTKPRLMEPGVSNGKRGLVGVKDGRTGELSLGWPTNREADVVPALGDAFHDRGGVLTAYEAPGHGRYFGVGCHEVSGRGIERPFVQDPEAAEGIEPGFVAAVGQDLPEERQRVGARSDGAKRFLAFRGDAANAHPS